MCQQTPKQLADTDLDMYIGTAGRIGGVAKFGQFLDMDYTFNCV